MVDILKELELKTNDQEDILKFLTISKKKNNKKKGKDFYIIVSFLIISFGYLCFFYGRFIIDNLKNGKELEIKNSKEIINVNNDIEKIKKQRIDYLLNSENKQPEKIEEVTLGTFLYNENEIFEKIKQEYLNYRYNNIKDTILTREEGKEIFGKTLKLSIPKINVKINLISLQNKELKDDNFIPEIEKDLKIGAIRYPNKDIIEEGISLIYGHSSQNLWTKPFYSFFKDLPKIISGEEILINSSKKEYKYKVLESKEIETTEIKNYQNDYDSKGIKNGKKYIMLITCYPLNTSDKRWIVIGEQE